MRITAIRVRVLRSKPVGYGHDAAEIEAQLEDGDDPDAVAAELRRRCETEVRQAAERDRLYESLDSLRERVAREEDRLSGLKTEADAARLALIEFADFLNAAFEKGIVPPPEFWVLKIPYSSDAS